MNVLYKTNGCTVSVTDEKIIETENMLASRGGTFICPKGEATLSAELKLRDTGWIDLNESVFCLIPD